MNRLHLAFKINIGISLIIKINCQVDSCHKYTEEILFSGNSCFHLNCKALLLVHNPISKKLHIGEIT